MLDGTLRLQGLRRMGASRRMDTPLDRAQVDDTGSCLYVPRAAVDLGHRRLPWVLPSSTKVPQEAIVAVGCIT
jgi:hypothetical protein